MSFVNLLPFKMEKNCEKKISKKFSAHCKNTYHLDWLVTTKRTEIEKDVLSFVPTCELLCSWLLWSWLHNRMSTVNWRHFTVGFFKCILRCKRIIWQKFISFNEHFHSFFFKFFEIFHYFQYFVWKNQSIKSTWIV